MQDSYIEFPFENESLPDPDDTSEAGYILEIREKYNIKTPALSSYTGSETGADE